jgi:hypothetical protein
VSLRDRHVRAAYRREGGTWLIELRLREARQLLNHLDPAPFREQDLDPAAEQYIEEAVREIGAGRPLALIIFLPGEEAGTREAQALPETVSHYFAYRARQSWIELRRLMARGLASLVIGLLFLALCLSARASVQSRGGHEVLLEGLLIIGWVGLWRPVEIFLYDWWPVWRQRRRFDALARAPVRVEALPR